MSKIDVSVQSVRESAQLLRQLNGELWRTLQEMLGQMNCLESSWESETSVMIREKFNALTPHFEQYTHVIESYPSYLETTAENYEVTEATLQQNASSIQ